VVRDTVVRDTVVRDTVVRDTVVRDTVVRDTTYGGRRVRVRVGAHACVCVGHVPAMVVVRWCGGAARALTPRLRVGG
jgi:hypothetical protein